MTRPVIAFIAVVYALSIAFSIFAALTGGAHSQFAGMFLLVMFLPTVAMLVIRITTGEDARIDWARLPVRYLPLAMFLFPVLLHAVMLSILIATRGSIPWQDWLTASADGLYHAPAARGWGSMTGSALAGRIITNAVTGILIVSFLALLEEIGWRGWLLPRLVDRFGARQAVILTAVIWALWHVPFALSGVQHIDGVSPIRLAMTWPLGIAATGLVLGWLWLRTESIWIVAVAHGALNNWGQFAFKYMADFTDPPPMRLLGAGYAAVLAAGTALLLFAVPPLLDRRR